MLEEKIAELQARLDEVKFWNKLKKKEWPFSIENKNISDDLAVRAVTLLNDLAEKRISELEDENRPVKPKDPPTPTKEELKTVAEAKKILNKYEAGDSDVPVTSHTFQPNSEKAVTNKLEKGSTAALIDNENIRSVNTAHKTEFLVGDKVKVMKIYADRKNGTQLADIVKDSATGKIRATVDVTDLELI